MTGLPQEIAKANLGTAPEIEWVSKDAFDVDKTYQREISGKAGQKVINNIVANFNWSKFQPPTVVRKGKKFVVVDGQHRVEAARRHHGIDKIPVYIVKLDKVSEQAEAFVAINRVRCAVNPLALFHAQVAAGHKTALLIKEICDEAEVTIPKYMKIADLLGPRETQALGALKQHLAQPAELLAALILITDAYPDTNGMLCSAYIKALTRLFKMLGIKKIDRDVLIEVVVDNDPYELRSKSLKMKDVGANGPLAMAQVLAEEYHRRADASKKTWGRK